jgi:hypothetical protein
MKRDFLAMGLITVLIATTIATVGMCYWYLKSARNVREMQMGVNHVNRNRQALQALAVDLNNYARRNPLIYPTLEQLNLRMGPSSTNTSTGGQP